MDREWPFVGRAHELGQLRRLLRSEQCAGVVIAGPPGVGRTRLALEASRAMERGGARRVRIAGAAAGSALAGLA